MTIGAELALAAGSLLAQTTAARVSPARVLVAQTTVRESPPAALVRAIENKKDEINATVVEPCKKKRKDTIDNQRKQSESCGPCNEKLDMIQNQAYARCEIRGLDERIADLDERKKAVIARLETLLRQFQQQAQSNEALCDEIKNGETEAEAVFLDAAVGHVMDYVLNLPPDKQVEMLKAAEGRLANVSAVTRVQKGELGAFVAEMRAELAGKSKAEARAIVVARLDRVKMLVAGIRAANLASGQVASHNLDEVMGTKPDVTGERLDAAYASLLTSLQVVKDQSAENLAKAVKLDHVLGYTQHALGYGEDAVKISAVFGNLYQLYQNVDGLSSLQAAAESQRKTAKFELDYLVKTREKLAEERSQKQTFATP